jgi:hypothetical protein
MNSKWLKIMLLVLVCFVVFCVITILTRLYTVDDLQINYIGALLGTVITAVVTGLLLSGQSAAEEVKERNVKVFEKKSVIFAEYIDAAWKAWEDYTVSTAEFQQLVSDYYKKLMLFMSATSAKIIGEQLKIVGYFAGEESLTDKNKSELQTALIAIINTLSDEISLGGHIDESLFIELGKDIEASRSRRGNTSFKMLGIKPGTELVLKSDPTVKCVTVDEKNKVEYQEETLTIGALACRILERSANGFAEFMLNGKTLFELRGK